MSHIKIKNNINKAFTNIKDEYGLSQEELNDVKDNLRLKNIGFQTGGYKEINNKIMLQARELFPYKVDYNMKGGAKGKKSGSKKRGSKKRGSKIERKMQGTCTKEQGSEKEMNHRRRRCRCRQHLCVVHVGDESEQNSSGRPACSTRRQEHTR